MAVPNDKTAGAWILLGTAIYAKATSSNDGIMTKEQVIALTKAGTDITNINSRFTSDGSSNRANQLTTSRLFSITGGASASPVEFNGTANVALNVTSLKAPTLTGEIPAICIPAPTETTLGGVKAGTNIVIETDGTISANFNFVTDAEIDALFV